jgi:hypothetical protein
MTGAHQELVRLLAQVRGRWSQASTLTAAGWAAAAAAVPLAMAAFAARGLPSGLPLVGVAVVAMAGAIAALALVLRGRRRHADDRQVARFIEERAAIGSADAPLGDALVSAVEVVEARQRDAGEFGDLVVGRAVDRLRAIDPRTVVPRGEMRRAALTALSGSMLLLLALWAASPHLQRAAGTAWLVLFPRSIQIAVLTGDVRLPAGTPLQIEATVEGRGAKWLTAAPSLVVSADGQQQAVGMTPAGGRFQYTIDSIDRSFEYHVQAGSVSSRTHAVTALHPPRVTRIDLRYSYPAFTRLQPREEVDGGDIYGPAGTAVRLLVHTDKAIASGSLALGDGSLVPLSPAGGTSVSADLVLARDDGYRVRLVDTDGLGSRGDVEYFIRIMSDRPPDVRITRPSSDEGITPLQEVVIAARADDDYGIASLDLVYTVSGREPRSVPFANLSGTAVARTGSYTLEAEALGVQPGDVITYYARARDVPRGRPSVETRSDIFFLEVKPFNEEFVSAESQAMGAGSSGTQIDALIAAQKDIISATWNLERRSGAGRSAADLQAVAEAGAAWVEDSPRSRCSPRLRAAGREAASITWAPPSKPWRAPPSS